MKKKKKMSGLTIRLFEVLAIPKPDMTINYCDNYFVQTGLKIS